MILIIAALLCLLCGVAWSLALRDNVHRYRASIATQTIAAALTLIAVFPTLLGGPMLELVLPWSYPVNEIRLRVDSLSAFFLAFSLPMTLLGSIYAVGYLAPYFEKKRHAGIHFALLNLVSISFLLIYAVRNALVFLLGWEIAALSAWLLVIWDYKNQKVRFAGFNYLVSTHLGLLFLIAAFMLIHASTGTFDFPAFKGFLQTSSPLRNVTFLLLVTSFGLKSAFFPFHTWLPRAHSAAPAHVSALMSGVIHKAGIYGMLRFILLIETPEKWMGWYLVGFSTLSAFMGVLYTVSQRDIKRLLGYSSTENVGIAGIGIGVGCLGIHFQKPLVVALGFSMALLHVLNHALFKCLLFYAAGSIYRMTHTIDLERLGGLIRKMPYTSFFFLLGGLSISALPPFNGFVSEFLLYVALLGHEIPDPLGGAIWIMEAGCLAFIGGISALAITRSFGVAFLGSPRDSHIQCSGEAPRSMRFTMLVHAVGALAIGLFPTIGLRCVEGAAQQFLPQLNGSANISDVMASTRLLLEPISHMALTLVLVCALLWGLRKVFLTSSPRRHRTWGCGYLAPNPRMQYTGSSFSEQFVFTFRSLLRLLKREHLPAGPFPHSGSLNTHCVDAVERRMFKVLGDGEIWIERMAAVLRNEPYFSFAIGLIILIGVVSIIVSR